MSAFPGGFTVRETHGVLLRPGVEIRASSDNRGWHSLYASLQTVTPFEAYFAGVDDHLVVLHLGGPVSVHRRVQNGEASRVIPPGGLFMMPGGMDFGVRDAADAPSVPSSPSTRATRRRRLRRASPTARRARVVTAIR